MAGVQNFDLVLLDRDGVINVESGEFIKGVAEWHPLPGALEAIVALLRAGIRVAVCTNQSGVGRGLLTEADLNDIHEAMHGALARLGGRPIPVYHCPHLPDAGCACRKPAPGMLLEAMRDLDGVPARTCFVGDSPRDLEAASGAGCTGVLVRTGHGAVTERGGPLVEVYADLAAYCRHLGVMT